MYMSVIEENYSANGKKKLNQTIVEFMAFILSCIHMTNIWVVLPTHFMRGIHLGFILMIVFLVKDFENSKSDKFIRITEMMIGLSACLYYVVFYEDLSLRGSNLTLLDQMVAILLIVVLIDATIRTIGKGMAIVTITFLLYMFLGKYLPGSFGHAGYKMARIASHMFVSPNGVFGSLLQISATYLAMFTLLGTFLDKCGASNAFINIAMKLTGKMQGGPALAAVVASCLFGMINGSAVVNVVTTGTFTIPLMKSLGITSYVAGAVEAAASTGGQLMPPIMGAGAFIMSDITGVSYSEVVIKALIPALVFFIGVFGGVYFYVKRENIPTIDQSLLPTKSVIFRDSYMLIPMLIVFILILIRMSAVFSALIAIISALCLIIMQNVKNPRKIGDSFYKAMAYGAINLSGVATGLACAGVITGVVTLTGLGSKFVTLILQIASGQPLLSLVLVALACLILGMGLPTSAAYVITATMAVPAMTQMGFPVFASHLFVFYFAVIAPVTPPVAIAAYAAAGIADSNPTQTGYKSFIFAIPAFLMPFMFIYNPLLLAEGPVMSVLWASFTAIFGAVALAAASQGYCFMKINNTMRIILMLSALSLILPGSITDIIGVLGTAYVVVSSYFKYKKNVEGEKAYEKIA
jgi:TRAP transporter 4TM/12TM fusion protein